MQRVAHKQHYCFTTVFDLCIFNGNCIWGGTVQKSVTGPLFFYETWWRDYGTFTVWSKFILLRNDLDDFLATKQQFCLISQTSNPIFKPQGELVPSMSISSIHFHNPCLIKWF